MNSVILIGRLARDPEVRRNTETAVARFTLAVDRAAKDKGADFLPCIAFNKTADIIERYCAKGKQIAVNGRLQSGSYEKDGKTIYTLDVVCDRIELLGSAKGEASEQKTAPEGFSALDDTLPF